MGLPVRRTAAVYTARGMVDVIIEDVREKETHLL